MLTMTHLQKVYRTHLIETYALRDFSIRVEEGEFVAVTGPSGSGKTTFLNICGLLEEFTAGQYQLDGVDVRGLGDSARSRLRNEKIGFIFQSFNLIPDLNLFDNVDVPLRYRRIAAGERKRRIEEALARVGLASRMKHYPSELSGGQQQRVACARALASRPAIVFADEPTGNLDSRSGAEVLGFLRRSVDEFGQTIVMVTHDPNAASYAQRVVFLADGRIVDEMADPTAERVLDRMKRFDVEGSPAPAPVT